MRVENWVISGTHVRRKGKLNLINGARSDAKASAPVLGRLCASRDLCDRLLHTSVESGGGMFGFVCMCVDCDVFQQLVKTTQQPSWV